jgi:anaerobic ribonucleoside-triphosphate reductase activating protein
MLNLHAILPRSRANGPGVRTVLWFQGCPLHCRGCFNPGTHAFDSTLPTEPDALLARLVAERHAIEGITVSGGEPLSQAAGLLHLLQGLRSTSDLSVILFSGYRRSEIERQPLGSTILAAVDVLVDGRYVEERRLARGLRGSSNQVIHLLTDRYRREDLERTPVAEAVIDAAGNVVFSGVRPPRLSVAYDA